MILRHQTLQVSNVSDFDDLPTPFRAVAADIETGEAHVMSDGDIVHAMRASMSAPGIFSPVHIDGHRRAQYPHLKSHIGVLRELENMRVPIDAIAGTSMGAIVGGLYASGKTPAELEDLIASLDWKYAFQDTISREHMIFRRKQDDEAFPIRVELGRRDGDLVLPEGLISGQNQVGVASAIVTPFFV